MADEEMNELLLTALSVFIFGVIVICAVKYYPQMAAAFERFVQNSHGNF